jgi:hypothetical protein
MRAGMPSARKRAMVDLGKSFAMLAMVNASGG